MTSELHTVLLEHLENDAQPLHEAEAELCLAQLRNMNTIYTTIIEVYTLVTLLINFTLDQFITYTGPLTCVKQLLRRLMLELSKNKA